MKRGQISMFIIVGIIILLVIGLGVAAWKIINEQKPPEDKNKEETNIALKPLQTYVKACLDSTAEQVLTDTALHGGYYEPEQYGFVAIPGRPTESNALEPFPGTVLPYWSYISSPNTCSNCLVRSEQPPLTGERYPAVEYQVENAIETNLNTCLKDFDLFKDEFAITVKGEPSVAVSFGQSSTIVNLTYVLDVQTQAESVSTLRTFTTEVDVPFKKAYDYASTIRETMDYQQQPFFAGLTLELITLEAIAPADKEPIPPPFGGTMQSSYPGPYWTLPRTRDILAHSFENNINNVQLLGSKNMDFVNTSDPIMNNYYANYYFSVENPDPNIAVNFMYFTDWEPYVAIHPGGQLIHPQTVSVGLPFLPAFKKKDFQYDVSYPVLTQLRLENKRGDEFLFQFPVEVNVRNNNPVAFDDIIVPEPDYSFCDPALATGSIVNISTVDQNGEGVSADVYYSCIDNSCNLGTAMGGRLEGVRLPVCIGGEIEASREGFHGARKALDSTAGKTAETELVLQKRTSVVIEAKGRYVQKVPVSVDINGVISSDWVLADNDFDIDIPQKMILVLTPRDDPQDTQILTYPDGSEGAHTLNLYPAVYDITAVVTEEPTQPKVVHGGEICVDTDPLNPFGGEECTDIPDVVLGSGTYRDENGVEQQTGSTEMYVGGLEWNEDTKNVTITQEMLDRGTVHIQVPVVYLPHVEQIGENIDDLEAFDKVESLGLQLEIT